MTQYAFVTPARPAKKVKQEVKEEATIVDKEKDKPLGRTRKVVSRLARSIKVKRLKFED